MVKAEKLGMSHNLSFLVVLAASLIGQRHDHAATLIRLRAQTFVNFHTHIKRERFATYSISTHSKIQSILTKETTFTSVH